MTQRSLDTIKCTQQVYMDTVTIEKLEPSTSYMIDKSIAAFAGGKGVIPFFHIPTGEDDYLEFMKSLFYLSSKDTAMKASDCLVLYINIVRGSFVNLDREIKRSLIDSGMECILYNEQETEAWLLGWISDMFEADDYTGCEVEAATVKVCIGIYWNFITKRLTAANIEGWLKKRRGAYATACQIADDEEELLTLSPDLGFAGKVNQSHGFLLSFQDHGLPCNTSSISKRKTCNDFSGEDNNGLFLYGGVNRFCRDL